MAFIPMRGQERLIRGVQVVNLEGIHPHEGSGEMLLYDLPRSLLGGIHPHEGSGDSAAPSETRETLPGAFIPMRGQESSL